MPAGRFFGLERIAAEDDTLAGIETGGHLDEALFTKERHLHLTLFHDLSDPALAQGGDPVKVGAGVEKRELRSQWLAKLPSINSC